MDMVSYLVVILSLIGLFLLAKHNWNNKFLADKWGVWGIIALLLAIIICYAMLYVAGLMVWGADL
jgi:hypothetical protein